MVRNAIISLLISEVTVKTLVPARRFKGKKVKTQHFNTLLHVWLKFKKKNYFYTFCLPEGARHPSFGDGHFSGMGKASRAQTLLRGECPPDGATFLKNQRGSL